MNKQIDEGPEAAADDPVGCNIIALILVLILLAAFGAAAWVNRPSAAPDPVDTGVPPTAPTGS